MSWARGYRQISGAYDPGYSSGEILGHIPLSTRIRGGFGGYGCLFFSQHLWGFFEVADLGYMVSITWHTRNTWEYTGKKGGFGRKGYVACTGGYECIMHNACIGGLGNTSSLPIVMVNVVFETTPFWALGVYGRILKAPIPQYTAVYSGVYGRILGVYGRILWSIRPYTWSIRPYTGGICLHHVVVSS